MSANQTGASPIGAALIAALVGLGCGGGTTVERALGPSDAEARRLGALLGESADLPAGQVYRASVIVLGTYYQPLFTDQHEWGEDLLTFDMFQVEETIRGQVAVSEIYLDLGGLDPAGIAARLTVGNRYLVLLAPADRSQRLLADGATQWNLTTIIEQRLGAGEVVAVVPIEDRASR